MGLPPGSVRCWPLLSQLSLYPTSLIPGCFQSLTSVISEFLPITSPLTFSELFPNLGPRSGCLPDVLRERVMASNCHQPVL